MENETRGIEGHVMVEDEMKVRTQVAWESQWDTLMLLGVE